MFPKYREKYLQKTYQIINGDYLRGMRLRLSFIFIFIFWTASLSPRCPVMSRNHCPHGTEGRNA